MTAVRFHTDEGTDAERLWHACSGPGAPEPEPGSPRIGLLLIGDGRDATREATLASFLEMASGFDLRCVIEIDDRHHEMGFAGAIRSGWYYMRQAERGLSEPAAREHAFDYVFHLEEDWRFLREFDVRELARVLRSDERLAQVALRRGAVNEAEAAAGGVVEMWPTEYETRSAIGQPYLVHDLYFTTNPCLYRIELMLLRWPEGPQSERAFTERCAAFGYRFALFGDRTAPVLIEHTGTRQGTGY
jgi:hypothetical protein